MSLPIISIKDIPDDGLVVDASIDAAWLRRELDGTGFEPARDPAGRAEVRLDISGRDVVLAGRATAWVRGECVRCLAAIELELAPEFVLHLAPATSTARTKADRKGGKPEVELSRDELDQDCYEDERVDVGRWVREQILLEVPAHPRCAAECAGPLVAAPPVAAIDSHSIDPRLAPLLHIVANKKE